MTFNYAHTALTASRLLQRFGASCLLTRSGPGVYDPATGTNTPTITNYPTMAAVFAYDQKYINNTLILQGDQRAYLAPSVAPLEGDALTWQGKAYTVISVRPVSPAGVPVLFEAQIRG